MSKVDVKFSEWIQQGFNLFKENMVTLILVNLLAIVISASTFGILGGPMYAGVILVTLGLLDKKQPKPEVGEVFEGFNYFLQAFLFYICIHAVILVLDFILFPRIGTITSTGCINILTLMRMLVRALRALVILKLVGFVIMTPVMFGLFLIVDKRMDFWPAAKMSYEKVKENFWPLLGLFIVASILGQIGVILCCIGVFVTAPIMSCILAVAYRAVFSQTETPTAPPPAPAPNP